MFFQPVRDALDATEAAREMSARCFSGKTSFDINCPFSAPDEIEHARDTLPHRRMTFVVCIFFPVPLVFMIEEEDEPEVGGEFH
jgi:hypothetical protein